MTEHSKEDVLCGEYKVYKEMPRDTGASAASTLLFKKNVKVSCGNWMRRYEHGPGTPFEKLDTGEKVTTHRLDGRASDVCASWASIPGLLVLLFCFRDAVPCRFGESSITRRYNTIQQTLMTGSGTGISVDASER